MDAPMPETGGQSLVDKRHSHKASAGKMNRSNIQVAIKIQI